MENIQFAQGSRITNRNLNILSNIGSPLSRPNTIQGSRTMTFSNINSPDGGASLQTDSLRSHQANGAKRILSKGM